MRGGIRICEHACLAVEVEPEKTLTSAQLLPKWMGMSSVVSINPRRRQHQQRPRRLVATLVFGAVVLCELDNPIHDPHTAVKRSGSCMVRLALRCNLLNCHGNIWIPAKTGDSASEAQAYSVEFPILVDTQLAF